jgi:ABC-type multidrug transport system permease subunit
MTILIFVAAVTVVLVLERQKRRHIFEITLEYQKLLWELPMPEPRIPMLESWLNALLGVVMAAFGVLMLLTFLQVPADKAVPGWGNTVALFLASGIALTVVGGMAVWQNFAYKKQLSQG